MMGPVNARGEHGGQVWRYFVLKDDKEFEIDIDRTLADLKGQAWVEAELKAACEHLGVPAPQIEWQIGIPADYGRRAG